ncbi:MAG: hypothetical protein P4L61_02075 [Candidatus Pacebacteria bacterium]|nr:hypothetical protein [Candidatus Paceibacterota bacterium]
MLKTIKALVGIGREAKQLRSLSKNTKIFIEFPWLWAIRQEWELTRLDLKISKSIPSFIHENILADEKEGDDAICGVYLHCMSGDDTMLNESVLTIWDGVEPLERIAEFPEEKWRQAMHERIYGTTHAVLHIALVSQKGNVMAIYRPDSSESFNSTIHGLEANDQ